MNWRTKALIQSFVARLPDRLSYPLYYQLQRRFGGLRQKRIDPTNRMQVGIDICQQIVAQGQSPIGATFFEVGTGWRLNLPIACWLCGADRFVTVDLNRYLRFELVREDLHYLRRHADAIERMFRSQVVSLFDESRWHQLLGCAPRHAEDFCHRLGIDYLAPADATCTELADQSIDYHVSCNVLEHIPGEVIHGIFQEAGRIVRPGGLLVHRVDHSDHFAHSDARLPAIHFLQYSDHQWQRWTGNRYAYVNRLREDDYLRMLTECGHDVRLVQSDTDEQIQELLQDFPLDARFCGKPVATLSHLASLFVAQRTCTQNAASKTA